MTPKKYNVLGYYEPRKYNVSIDSSLVLIVTVRQLVSTQLCQLELEVITRDRERADLIYPVLRRTGKMFNMINNCLDVYILQSLQFLSLKFEQIVLITHVKPADLHPTVYLNTETRGLGEELALTHFFL